MKTDIITSIINPMEAPIVPSSAKNEAFLQLQRASPSVAPPTAPIVGSPSIDGVEALDINSRAHPWILIAPNPIAPIPKPIAPSKANITILLIACTFSISSFAGWAEILELEFRLLTCGCQLLLTHFSRKFTLEGYYG
jgi:hypothetical protein